MTDAIAAIITGNRPHTLARVADGFLPLLIADLARASDKRLVYVATDEAAMAAIADAAPFFAPDLIIHRFPAWDCLPYDRAGPSLRQQCRAVGHAGGPAGPRAAR